MDSSQDKLIVFQDKNIRRTWYNEEWWFSVQDVIEAITGTNRVRKYWNDLKKKLGEEGLSQLSDKIGQLKIEAQDGKMRKTDCANTEGLFRIIQSIPSPRAEPFKRWLAKVGYERIQEIENPELAAERARQYYRDLGYNDSWIEKRLQSIGIRGQLTDEWKERDVKEGLEYAILTAEISKASFGMTPSEYKKHKGLKRENLRDHMTNLELIFTMLGEEQTQIEAINKDAQGFNENKQAAQKAGKATGKALETFEQETNQKIVSEMNYLKQIEEAKKQKKLDDKIEDE
jgi:methylphosphotriester-DNA--protein-cysteine methyltransferase